LIALSALRSKLKLLNYESTTRGNYLDKDIAMTVLIPFARHIQSQKVVSIDEVDKGLACNCMCLCCQTPLVANKGTEKVHHFSHKAKESNDESVCPISYERSVFWMVRQILQESNTFRTPSGTLDRESLISGINRVDAIQSKQIVYESIDFPHSIYKENKDCALLSIKGHKLSLTIAFNSESLGYLESRPFELNGKKYPHLHINLSGLKDMLLGESDHFKETLRQYLLYETSNKTWLYHPKMEKVLSNFKQQDEIEMHTSSHQNKVDAPFKKHLRALTQSAISHYENGVQEVKQCNRCYFFMTKTVFICGSCSAREFTNVLLTHDFVKNIESYYRESGHLEKSYSYIYKNR